MGGSWEEWAVVLETSKGGGGGWKGGRHCSKWAREGGGEGERACFEQWWLRWVGGRARNEQGRWWPSGVACFEQRREAVAEQGRGVAEGMGGRAQGRWEVAGLAHFEQDRRWGAIASRSVSKNVSKFFNKWNKNSEWVNNTHSLPFALPGLLPFDGWARRRWWLLTDTSCRCHQPVMEKTYTYVNKISRKLIEYCTYL